MAKVLVVVDVQKEVQTPGRAYFIEGVDRSLQVGREVLALARNQSWPILHVRHLQEGDLYGFDSPLSDFITGFEPHANEVEVIKSDYSCYSSPEFSALMAQHRDDEILLIGYGTTKCVLTTVVEGYHRGNSLTLVSDASGAQALGTHSAEQAHKFACELLATYCTVQEAKCL